MLNPRRVIEYVDKDNRKDCKPYSMEIVGDYILWSYSRDF